MGGGMGVPKSDNMWDDLEYEEVAITGVDANGTGYVLRREDGWSFGVLAQYDDEQPHGVTPTVGDVARFYGRGIGFGVRGLTINGRLVFYRTEQEDRDRHAAMVLEDQAKRLHEFEKTGRAKLDAEYNALPDVFKRRIDKFRANNPDFRWEYEGYEMFCCTEAMKLARHWGTVEAAKHYTSLATSGAFSADEARWHREWEEQKAIDKAAGISDDHSGNTHGAAVALAFWYLEHPENVARMHGALSPLVGSEEYGDVPKDDAARGGA